jgi:hypothetical protein
MREECAKCFKGYSMKGDRLSFAERRCCEQCDPDGTPKGLADCHTIYEDKVDSYLKGTDGMANSHPCQNCGQHNHCATEIKKENEWSLTKV